MTSLKMRNDMFAPINRLLSTRGGEYIRPSCSLFIENALIDDENAF